jgi:hypothetical protein
VQKGGATVQGKCYSRCSPWPLQGPSPSCQQCPGPRSPSPKCTARRFLGDSFVSCGLIMRQASNCTASFFCLLKKWPCLLDLAYVLVCATCVPTCLLQDVARSHLSSESPSPQTTHRACAASEFHLNELPYTATVLKGPTGVRWGVGELKAQDGWQRCRLPTDRFTISVQRFMYTSRTLCGKKSPNFRVRPLSRLVCASVRDMVRGRQSNQVF